MGANLRKCLRLIRKLIMKWALNLIEKTNLTLFSILILKNNFGQQIKIVSFYQNKKNIYNAFTFNCQKLECSGLQGRL